MRVIGMIADHPTPKISVGGNTAYTQNSRDYKGVMIVVVSKCDRESDGKRISETWNARSNERNVCCGK